MKPHFEYIVTLRNNHNNQQINKLASKNFKRTPCHFPDFYIFRL